MKLVINLENVVDVQNGITLLTNMLGSTPAEMPETPAVVEEESFDDLLGGGSSDADDLESLMGGEAEPEVPATPTVEDIKKAITTAIGAKGKDATNTFLQSVMKKLGVTQLSAIKDDKRQSFIDVMKAFESKK